MTQAPKYHSLWIAHDAVPEPLQTPHFALEPLTEQHAELDFEALMSCRARLQRELQWGDWPPEDFTLEENRADLRRHHGEFLRGEAFAYTVLNPTRTRCLGCIYLERCPEINGAQLAFWVIDDALNLEATLLTEVLKWVHHSWSIERVLIPLREANARGLELARECGFGEWEIGADSSLANHFCFLAAAVCGEESM